MEDAANVTPPDLHSNYFIPIPHGELVHRSANTHFSNFSPFLDSQSSSSLPDFSCFQFEQGSSPDVFSAVSETQRSHLDQSSLLDSFLSLPSFETLKVKVTMSAPENGQHTLGFYKEISSPVKTPCDSECNYVHCPETADCQTPTTDTGNEKGPTSTDNTGHRENKPVEKVTQDEIRPDSPSDSKTKVVLSQEKRDQYGKKRKRYTFTSSQLVVFEKLFEKEHYPKRFDILQLEHELNIPEAKVRTWFQNRRAREKRGKVLIVDSATTKQSVLGKPTQYVAPMKIPEWSQRLLSQRVGQQLTETIRSGPTVTDVGFQQGSPFSRSNVSTLGNPPHSFVYSNYNSIPSSVTSSGNHPPSSLSNYLFPRETYPSSVGNSGFPGFPCCSSLPFTNLSFSSWNREDGQTTVRSPPLTPSPCMWSPNTQMAAPLSFPSFIPVHVPNKDSASKENISFRSKNNIAPRRICPLPMQMPQCGRIPNPFGSTSSINPITFWPHNMNSVRPPMFNASYDHLNAKERTTYPLPMPMSFHQGFYPWGGYAPNGLYSGALPMSLPNMHSSPVMNVFPDTLSPDESSDDD